MTRIFFPESSDIGGLYWRACASFCYLPSLFSGGMRRRLERSLSRVGARTEHPVLGVRRATEAPRPGAVLRRATKRAFTRQIYEPPLQYHYLKRPYELIPLTAVEIPKPREIEGGRFTVYEIRIRPGIKYQPHPGFVDRESFSRPEEDRIAEESL